MNVDLIAVGKIREPYVREGCGLYNTRLAPLLPIRLVEVKASTIAEEGAALLKRCPEDAVVWALDRNGRELSSESLARRLRSIERSGSRRFALVIGGADGLAEAVLARADFVWSLSQLTLLHEMARLVVLEQLYRAVKINRGEPYHR
jgi:23S rRNA (pseudouridine1915-N3)-methyltransferase